MFQFYTIGEERAVGEEKGRLGRKPKHFLQINQFSLSKCLLLSVKLVPAYVRSDRLTAMSAPLTFRLNK